MILLTRKLMCMVEQWGVQFAFLQGDNVIPMQHKSFLNSASESLTFHRAMQCLRLEETSRDQLVQSPAQNRVK